ncbi:5'/3'-nucleotidase SurE [Thorsellia kenyensis]|uniref:5'-nucleotidase n=1 Tax=Thorsellia kenyensis TaxID=1549888 RepID=A0ABV6CCN9_9GAMM
MKFKKLIFLLGMLGLSSLVMAKDSKPLKVLIVNDDGCRSFGTVELQKQLLSKGMDAWIVAPATNQSGIGSAITMKKEPFTYHVEGDRHYCFPGTPADALDFGLLGILRDAPPDLVISGVNDGPNTGVAQINSGTVGAAVRAIRYGYPALAVSIGWNTDELIAFKGFPSTEKYWPDSVEYTVNMVSTLAQNWDRKSPLLPAGTGLSINYPAYSKSEILGVKYIGNEKFPPAQHFYKLLDNNQTIQEFNPEVLKVDENDTDTGWLHKKYITYTIIDGDWNALGYEKQYRQLLDGVSE